MRVQTIEELRIRMADVVGEPMLQFADHLDHGVTFQMAGEAIDLMQRLESRADLIAWRKEASGWQCRCETENWSLRICSTQHTVFCVASVISRHQRYMQWLACCAPGTHGQQGARQSDGRGDGKSTLTTSA